MKVAAALAPNNKMRWLQLGTLCETALSFQCGWPVEEDGEFRCGACGRRLRHDEALAVRGNIRNDDSCAMSRADVRYSPESGHFIGGQTQAILDFLRRPALV